MTTSTKTLTKKQQKLHDASRAHNGELWSSIDGRGDHASARSLERNGWGVIATSQAGPVGSGYYFIWGRPPRDWAAERKATGGDPA